MQRESTKAAVVNSKKVMVAAFLFMMVGTILELYLLNHYEDVQQLIPILCTGASFIMAFILFFQKTEITLAIFQGLMALTALSGLYGIFLHLQANYEFEQEMKPTAHGFDLFWESLSGALPTLAPGSMVILALIGYSYTLLLKQKQ